METKPQKSLQEQKQSPENFIKDIRLLGAAVLYPLNKGFNDLVLIWTQHHQCLVTFVQHCVLSHHADVERL